MTRAPSTTHWWWMWAAVTWTAFVWVGRIRNALADDTLSTSGLRGALAMSVVSLALAAVVAGWAVAARREPVAPSGLRTLVAVTLVWTVGLWLVRIYDIVSSGRWGGAFIAVHTTLGILSVALWAVALVTAPESRSEEIPRYG